MGTNAQKKYFPNPVPDAFYTGNTDTYSYLDGDHLREDYYAWTWGDALFVVIDPYWYTMTKPFAGNTGGGEPEAGDGDRWHWTLGLQQFNWLKTTLENSTAKYKFIFAHHMVGGSDDYVRGGANPAHLVEWGGYNEAGTTYGWAAKRPGWGSEPIHQILVDNHVSAFFHGHDHQYAYEKRDGVVYQSLPCGRFFRKWIRHLYDGQWVYDPGFAQSGPPARHGHAGASDGGLHRDHRWNGQLLLHD